MPDLPALTGLRFFAAFFILFAHACDWCAQFQDSQVRTYLGLVAMYGMPLFFVLSGFVIHYNYASLFSAKRLASAIAEFAAARFARLFPLYAVLLAVAIVADNFTARAAQQPELVKDVLLFFTTLTQTWFYRLWDGKLMATSLFPLAWSISTEMFFYVTYIGVVFWMIRIVRLQWVIMVSIVGATLLISLLLLPLYMMDIQSLFYRWLFYFSPYVRVFEFLIGCLTAQAFLLARRRPVSRLEQRVGSILLTAALFHLVFFGLVRMGLIVRNPINGIVNHLTQNFFFAPSLAVLIFCVSRYPTRVSHFLSLPSLVVLGKMSYSIYLVHTWTLRLFNHPPPPLTLFWGLEAIARVLIAIVFTLMVAYGTYRIVEVPSGAYLRRFFAKWSARPDGIRALGNSS